MNINFNRRLTFNEHRNLLSICLLIILLLGIYLTINSVKKYENQTNLSVAETRKIYLCPELSSSSKGYIRVDFSKNFSRNYSQICKSNDILLIYILSTAKHSLRREAIRRSWANKNDYQKLNKVCFVFIVGLSKHDPNLLFHGNIQYESNLYGDIVQLNVDETYQNVVYKEVGALKWSHLYASQIPFLFKTDDDLVLDSILLVDIVTYLIHGKTDHSIFIQNQKQLQDFIQQMTRVDRYTFFKGKDLGGIPTLRSGKFHVNELAWNHQRLPNYCSGFGFLFSSFIRDRLYRASLCYATEYVPWVGDLFVSGFLAGAASVRCSGWSLSSAQTFEACHPLFRQQPLLLVCSTPLHKGQQVYEEFGLSWKAILDRHHIIMKSTTTLINNIYLTNKTNTTHIEPTTNSTKTIELVKQYEINRTSSVLFINISNETNSTKMNKSNLTNDKQEKILETNPIQNVPQENIQ